jgi:hypothetical protein
MQYKLPKFSAPASWNTPQVLWDLAFLTKDEFIKKHSRKVYEDAKNS